LKVQTEEVKKRLEDVDFVIQKLRKRTSNQDELLKKVVTLEQDKRVFEARMTQDLAQMNNNLEITREKSRLVQQEIEQYTKTANYIVDEVKRYQENLLDFKEKVNGQVSQLNIDLTERINLFQGQLQKVQDRDYFVEEKLKSYNEDFKKMDLEVETTKLEGR